MFTTSNSNIIIHVKFISISESYFFLNVDVSKCPRRGVCVGAGWGNAKDRYVDIQEGNFRKKIIVVSVCSKYSLQQALKA